MVSQRTETFQTRAQRLEAVLNLQEPDRVPVMPKMTWFAARYAGVTAEEFLFDPQKAVAAVDKTWSFLDGDIVYEPLPRTRAADYSRGQKALLPGKDISPHSIPQYVEAENMTPDDYSLATEKGWDYFVRNVLNRRLYPESTLKEIEAEVAESARREKPAVEEWRHKGYPCLVGSAAYHPLVLLSFARSVKGLFKDIYRYPDRIIRFSEAHTPQVIEAAKRKAKESGIPRVRIAFVSATTCASISPKKWELFVWPYFKMMVEEFVKEGLRCYLHCDGDWNSTLHYLLRLPRASCIVDLDGTSDMFRAKEILRGHLAISGDVPAQLLTLAQPWEVIDYCQKLIEVVGEGGGFMLSSGCGIPVDAKPENVKAMVETAKTHGNY